MKYKYNTPFYSIPTLGEGERRSEQQEQLGAQIIENQLRGIMAALGKGVIKEGEYRLGPVGDGLQLQLVPNGGPAIQAILRDGLLQRVNPLIWNIFTRGTISYCGLRFHPDQYLRPDQVQLVVTSAYITSYETLLLAIVDDREKKAILKTQDIGFDKRYISLAR